MGWSFISFWRLWLALGVGGWKRNRKNSLEESRFERAKRKKEKRCLNKKQKE